MHATRLTIISNLMLSFHVNRYEKVLLQSTPFRFFERGLGSAYETMAFFRFKHPCTLYQQIGATCTVHMGFSGLNTHIRSSPSQTPMPSVQLYVGGIVQQGLGPSPAILTDVSPIEKPKTIAMNNAMPSAIFCVILFTSFLSFKAH
jgi:hypothetical protein